MLIHITPEETVRQSFLNYLIKEVKIPITQLLVEEPVSHHQSETEIRNKGRIDVLVLDHENIPFIVYECKKETESFTDNVYSQAMDYFEAINSIDYVGVVIGNQIDLISFDYENDEVIAVKYAEHPKYTNLCLDNEEVLIEDLIFEDKPYIEAIELQDDNLTSIFQTKLWKTYKELNEIDREENLNK